jgi:DNA modification methylase
LKTVKTISIKCDCDKTIDFHELQSFQGGLKEHTESDYEKAKKSILQYGWSFVLYYWNDGKKKWIIDGHNRCEVLSRLEAEGYIIPPIPAIEVFCKNRKEAKQKLLRLNSTFGRLSKESVLEFAEDIDLNFDEIALPDSVIDFTDATEPTETEGDDEAPEVDEKSEPVSKRGEMYELGKSILMCGDSTNAEDVARLMGGEKADMVFTDPPYGVSMSRSLVSGKDNSIMNDNLNDKDFSVFLEKAIKNIVDFSKNNTPLYLWIGFRGYSKAEEIVKKYYKINNCIVWEKPSIGLGGKGYRYQHELCIFSGNISDKSLSDVWRFGRDKQGLHPTMKPIDLVSYGLQNSSRGGDIVLDLFGGSGSTLIASEKLGRKCRMIELDERYCDVIRRRYTQWAKENGKPITSGCLE